MTEIYCSTGVFVGRPNNRNHNLIKEYGAYINCDGFELMLYDTWHDRGKEIIRELSETGLRFPVLHSDKQIGDMLSDPQTNIDTVLSLWTENCAAAADIGAQKIVVHPWGIPHSDKYIEIITHRLSLMLDVAQTAGVTMLVENCLCLNASPIERLEQLAEDVPGLNFILDTRSAQFHAELMRTAGSKLLSDGKVRHIHAIDYSGGYMDFDSRYPIPDPGKGDVDFGAFFRTIAEKGYSDSVTLESSMHETDGVNVERINAALSYIRSKASVLQ